MEISKNQLDKIGRRIGSSERNPDDLKAVEDYRNVRIPELLELLYEINRGIIKNNFAALITGRPKRLKSIIRKLERSSGTKLSRMADIIGMRVIVNSLKEQNLMADFFEANFNLARPPIDYRDRDQYRAVHIYLKGGYSAIEVQIRTVPQQLWSIESEKFGEQVKEGVYTEVQKLYLNELSAKCAELDAGMPPGKCTSLLGIERGPIQGIYPNLLNNFQNSLKGKPVFKTYIITYDKLTNELLNSNRFTLNDLGVAIREYSRLTKLLREDEFDILLLNSTSNNCLRVTHPNYFPLPASRISLSN